MYRKNQLLKLVKLVMNSGKARGASMATLTEATALKVLSLSGEQNVIVDNVMLTSNKMTFFIFT